MSALNFNNLPSELKSIIFKINKDKEKEEYIENKNKYNEVINTFGTIFKRGNIGLIKQNENDTNSPFIIGDEELIYFRDLDIENGIAWTWDDFSLKRVSKEYDYDYIDELQE